MLQGVPVSFGQPAPKVYRKTGGLDSQGATYVTLFIKTHPVCEKVDFNFVGVSERRTCALSCATYPTSCELSEHSKIVSILKAA